MSDTPVVNDMVRSFMKNPSLFEATVEVPEKGEVVLRAYVEGNDKKEAQDIIVSVVCKEFGITPYEIGKVSTMRCKQ
jgi:hypothetical protein